MRQEDAETSPPILPPRPNPGPEPWPLAERPSAWWLLAFVVVCLLLAWLYLRRKKHAPFGAPVAVASENAPAATGCERLIGLVEHVRETMARQLGPSWYAMTTEEIAAALRGMDGIEPNLTDRTRACLALADRAKFAGGEITDDHLAEVESWVADFLVFLDSAGARSSHIGR